MIAAGLGGCDGRDASLAGTQGFRDCETCPEMIELPAGTFSMGTAENERLIDPRTGVPATNDGPQHEVTLERPFAIGKYEVTVGQFAEFVAATGYETVDRCMEFSKPNSFSIRDDVDWRDTGFDQSNDHPVVCVSFFDAQAYANWLAKMTGAPYRLPTEAEWEYAARGGATTAYHWGTSAGDACRYANVRSPGAFAISERQAESDTEDGFPCDDGEIQSSAIGRYAPNGFGLYDVQGNAWEWVADCSHKDYDGAPADGSAWRDEDESGCRFGVIRGGSYLNRIERSSTTVRAGRPMSAGATNMGFRVAKGPWPGGAAESLGREGWNETQAGPAGGRGAEVFADNCAACHVRSDDFEGLYGTDLDALVTAIRDGGNNVMSMPAFGNRLDEAEIKAVAEFVRAQNDWTD